MKLKRDKRTGLKYFNANDIRSWEPCYDPKKYFTDDERLNAIKILKDKRISYADKLWCVLRIELVSEKLMRLFAVWCARQVQHLITDKRSLDALDVAERYANGLATKEELAAARVAAWGAAWDAAWAAALAAACDAARDAAGEAAREAAWAAANVAARDKQIKKLIEMVKAEGLERVK